MRRTFRHPASTRFIVPFIVCVAPATGLGVLVSAPGWTPGYALIGIPVFLIVLVGMGSVLWGASVRIDDVGILGKEGKNLGGLRWEEIGGMEAVATRSRLDVALVEKNRGARHTLPVLKRNLYEAPKERLGPLPERDERELNNRWKGFP